MLDTRIGLVGCVARKLSRPAPAKDLYISPLFFERRRYVEQFCDRWYIISALHGLVDPDTVLEPYNVSLREFTTRQRSKWGARVLSSLDHLEPAIKGITIEFHSGALYREPGLILGLKKRGATISVPFSQTGIGTQISAYQAALRERAPAQTSQTDFIIQSREDPSTYSVASARDVPYKYLPLSEFLEKLDDNSIRLSFDEIEAILGDQLPKSAIRYPAWWSNTSSYSRIWRSVGWRTKWLSIPEERVSFVRQGVTKPAGSENPSPQEHSTQKPIAPVGRPRSEGYLRLSKYLVGQTQDSVNLSFDEIEAILQAPLPQSARRYPAWWSNTEQGHSHSRAWLSVGRKARWLSIPEGRVSFVRHGEFDVSNDQPAEEFEAAENDCLAGDHQEQYRVEVDNIRFDDRQMTIGDAIGASLQDIKAAISRSIPRFRRRPQTSTSVDRPDEADMPNTRTAERRDPQPDVHLNSPTKREHPAELPTTKRPATISVELGPVSRLEPFSFRWPDMDEHFESGWAFAAKINGHSHHVRHGIGTRDVFGRLRVHTVTWLDGAVQVEGVESDDYPTTRTLVSRIRRADRKTAREMAEVPTGYESFKIVRHQREIDAPWSPHCLAVKIAEDDLASWAKHAWLRSQLPPRTTTATPVRETPTVISSLQPPTPSPNTRAVVAALLDHAEELEERQKNQVTIFTPDKNADALVRNDGFAFLLAVIADMGIKAERAWAIPYELQTRIGHLEPARFLVESETIYTAFQQLPKLHRFVDKVSNWFVEAAKLVVEKYDGEADHIWADQPTAIMLRNRLVAFPGIGQKKAAMAVEILARDLGKQLRGLSGSDVAYDVHLRRVFLRTGLANRDDVSHMVEAARSLYPERPGALDFPAWDIGRTWCKPTDPDCAGCPLTVGCLRLTDRTSGVKGI